MKKAENKSNDETRQSAVIFLPSGRRGYVNDNSTIMEAAQELGVDLACICGGQGTCGKCKVEIKREFLQAYGVNSLMENLSPPNEVEEKLLSPGQRQDGYRLACQGFLLEPDLQHLPE
jgi:uncharacterized 2Fe-2S/4Fe-4S cluster protein (DUF4445 family)